MRLSGRPKCCFVHQRFACESASLFERLELVAELQSEVPRSWGFYMGDETKRRAHSRMRIGFAVLFISRSEMAFSCDMRQQRLGELLTIHCIASERVVDLVDDGY